MGLSARSLRVKGGEHQPVSNTGNTTFDSCANEESKGKQAQQTMQHSRTTKNTYVSPAFIFAFSLDSGLRVIEPPGTGSIVSRRRTPVAGKRTVCERSLSIAGVRLLLLDVEVVIADDPGGPPLALVFSDVC